MVGKRITFGDATWAAINLLRRERHRSFQQLTDEAFHDLLVKHGRPVGLEDQLKASVGDTGNANDNRRKMPTRSPPK